jgi:hypothetical protein
MSQAVAKTQQQALDAQAIEAALIKGDLTQLSPQQRVSYYNNVCSLVGLNPTTKPFDYLQLNGKLVLYAEQGVRRAAPSDLTRSASGSYRRDPRSTTCSS